MAHRVRRTWLLYVAILFNIAVYLDYIEATVLSAVSRKTEEFGGFIRFIGWESAFDAIDLLVIVWLLGATVCLFVRRALPHRFAVLTNLFLVPCTVFIVARHYQYYRQYIEAYSPALADWARIFHIVAIRGAFLVAGALLLLVPSVRSFFEHESSNAIPYTRTAAVAIPCLVFCVAMIYVRAPW